MKIQELAIAFVVLAVVAVLISAAMKKQRVAGRKATGLLTRKAPLTEREQSMYFRLTQSMPETIVLAQVAFSALLDTKDKPTRGTFDRKTADFVVCSKAFDVIAVVELDDSSHKGRAAHDGMRDALLSKAGYKVLRFKNIPDKDEVLAAFARLSS